MILTRPEVCISQQGQWHLRASHLSLPYYHSSKYDTLTCEEQNTGYSSTCPSTSWATARAAEAPAKFPLVIIMLCYYVTLTCEEATVIHAHLRTRATAGAAAPPSFASVSVDPVSWLAQGGVQGRVGCGPLVGDRKGLGLRACMMRLFLGCVTM